METRTFLFTDIEGSTALLRRVGEDVYAEVLAGHHAAIRSALAAHDGAEVGTQGDGFFAVFLSPSGCVAAVLEMQLALQAHAWPAGEHVRVRMGVHTGEASQTTTGLVGLDIHRAARVAAVAHGGQVLVSETAAALVRDSLPAGAALKDLGVHQLKDLGHPERIFQLLAAGLAAEFPALRSLGNPALQHNLPVQLTPFIGRGRELSEVRALLESEHLVTLTGAGGCGKTRLALQVAAELLDGSGDGVWLAELASIVEEDAVPAAIATALRIAVRPSRPVLETLVDALAPQNMLVMLDNCEHLIGTCAKVADVILRHCPRVHLVVTSREPLGIAGETIYRVPSLSLPGSEDGDSWTAGSFDAVALFVNRARAQGIDLPVDEQTGSVLVSICRRLDGMPLAIELAAARLRSMSLSELHDRLHHRFRLLTGGSRTALERQQTLRATVDWSYGLLIGTEKLLLGRLSVFPAGFDLRAAEAVCGFGDIAAFEVTDLVGSLVDKSLVIAERAGDAVRYRLLETIREFAAERMFESSEDDAAAAAAAHCAHYLAIAEAAAPQLAGPDQGQLLSQLDADQANLRRAAEYAAAEPGGTVRVLRLGVALRRYWMARRAVAGTIGLIKPVLDRPDARSDPTLFVMAAVTAMIANRVPDLAMVRRLGSELIEIAGELDDERLLIESLWTLCACYCFCGQPEEGRPLGEQAVERARRYGDDELLGMSLLGYLIGEDFIDQDLADQLYAEAIACAERSGDRIIGFILYNNAAGHALRAGDLPAARAHLERATEYMQSIGENSHDPLMYMGWVLRQEGDLDGARSMFEAGLRICRRYGDSSGSAGCSLGLACIAHDADEKRRAAELHGAAQAFLDRTDEVWAQPEADYRQRNIEDLRARLGDAEFDRAYAAGAALSVDGAFGLAIGRRP